MRPFRTVLSLLLTLILAAVSPALAGCATDASDEDEGEGALEAKDESARFQDTLQSLGDKRTTRQLIETLKSDYRIVFVPGFYNIAENLGQGRTDQAELYFEDEMQWLEDEGVCWSISVGDVTASPEANAKKVESEIRDPQFSRVRTLKRLFSGHLLPRHCERKPAIVVSHSRGGIDVLQTLYANPDFATRSDSPIKAWVSLQSPFQGSQFASDFGALVEERATQANILRLAAFLQNIDRTQKMGEDLAKQAPNAELVKQMMRVIAVDERVAWMRANEPKLAALLASRLPIISVGTVQPDRRHIPELLEIPRDYLEAKYGPNDGFIVRGAARLPGTSYVEFEGDHLSTVFFMGGRMKNIDAARLAEKALNLVSGSQRPDRVLSFAALLSMSLEKIKQRVR